MKFSVLLMTVILTSLTLQSAWAETPLVCDRQKIQQALQQTRGSQQLQRLAKMPAAPPVFKVTPRLERIFQRLQQKTFGQQVLHIEDFPAFPGLTRNGNVLQFSSLTDKSLQENLENPDIGAAFEIAHELGHVIQEVAFAKSRTHLSPHGLKKVDPNEDSMDGMLLHSETDCIAVEIMHLAGFKHTDDILKSIALITEECKQVRPLPYCMNIDELRQASVQNFLNKFKNP